MLEKKYIDNNRLKILLINAIELLQEKEGVCDGEFKEYLKQELGISEQELDLIEF